MYFRRGCLVQRARGEIAGSGEADREEGERGNKYEQLMW
jgi:hypothetical protein